MLAGKKMQLKPYAMLDAMALTQKNQATLMYDLASAHGTLAQA